MIFCKELNKNFDSHTDMFKALRKNKQMIIDSKKSMIQKSYDKNQSVIASPISWKMFSNVETKGIEIDDNYYYIAVNSTNILDSHKDLHVAGIWKKSAKERNKKNYLVDTHVLSLGTTIARKEHVEIFTAVLPFKSIGKDYDGEAEVLIYKIPKDKIQSPQVKEWLESGDDIEASVRMQYVKLDLAIDSDEEENKEEKKLFVKYYPQIANKSEFENLKYFWVIYEAKNVLESSLVLFGSNSATGQVKNKEAVSDTSKTEVEESLQNNSSIFINLIK